MCGAGDVVVGPGAERLGQWRARRGHGVGDGLGECGSEIGRRPPRVVEVAETAGTICQAGRHRPQATLGSREGRGDRIIGGVAAHGCPVVGDVDERADLRGHDPFDRVGMMGDRPAVTRRLRIVGLVREVRPHPGAACQSLLAGSREREIEPDDVVVDSLAVQDAGESLLDGPAPSHVGDDDRRVIVEPEAFVEVADHAGAQLGGGGDDRGAEFVVG